jgi:hypothetical protein
MKKLSAFGLGLFAMLLSHLSFAVTAYDSLVTGISFADLVLNIMIVVGLLITFALSKNGAIMLYNIIKSKSRS